MLPVDIDQFLRKHIESIEALELLLALASDPTRARSCDELADEVGASARICRRNLEDLASRGLVARDGSPPSYRYAPTSELLRDEVTRVAKLYERRRLEVINAIVSRSIDRVRDFADAFRLKKEK